MGSLLLFGVACGGKVVVESSGPTGAGGAGTSSTASSIGDGGSTGDVSPVGVVSSSSGGQSLCQQLCDDQAAKGCNQGPNCVSDCQNAYATAGMCTPQLDAVVTCLLTTTDSTCVKPKFCEAQLLAYSACLSPTMCDGTTSCSGTSDGTCDCFAECNGSKFEVQCQPGNATDFCLCIKDGMPIDKCTQPQGTGLSCNVQQGCCANVFFPIN